MKKIVKYRNVINAQNSSATIKSDATNQINAITFINKSTDNFPTINGYPLAAGEAISFAGNNDEIDISTYIVTIDDAIGTPNLYVITKFNYFE